MELSINGKLHNFNAIETMTLSDLFTQLSLETTRGVAIAVNSQVVPKSKWVDYILNDRDHIEIIRATQGG